jgi:3-deoxy-D-manno-octulosonate 8-phosphate phosphatase (KDO 8-P phosphatase)
MDVDGTLTDGAMYWGPNGEVMKRFYVKDGMGLTVLHKQGIKTALLTAESSETALKRGQKLQIDKIILGCHDKSKEILKLSSEFNVSLDEIAYAGDDLNDYHVMKMCGLKFAPKDAISKIQNIADIVSTRNGGDGAIRELCEMISEAQGKEFTLDENW